MSRRSAREGLFYQAAFVAAAVLAIAGCEGEARHEDNSDGGVPVHEASLPPADARSCSAGGVSQSCDPVALTGCAGAGACYVVRDLGTACVCPPGEAAKAAACATTVECAPGHVCAGTRAPGVCRKTCLPSAPSCGAGEKCTVIAAFPGFGYCEPG